jgi:hypothetical protein
MYLRGKTKPYFLSFVEHYNYEIYNKINNLYKAGGAGVEYKDGLYKMVNELKAKYNVSSNYMTVLKSKMK